MCSIGPSYTIEAHWAQPVSLTCQKQECLWRPCLLTDPDEISNLYRGPSIGASYQVSVHLGK